jgi:hypothetical protein
MNASFGAPSSWKAAVLSFSAMLGLADANPTIWSVMSMNWVFLQFLQPTDRPNFLVSLGETTVNIRDVLVVAAGLHLVLMFGTPIASGSYHRWPES